LDCLDEVEKEYKAEFSFLKQKINKMMHEKMGDTRINSASPEQLSWLIYSRKVIDKKTWSGIFNIGIDKFTKRKKRRPKYSRTQLSKLVAENTELIYKTTASKCASCNGKGIIKKIKRDGSPYKKYSKCDSCDGEGFLYSNMASVAGFRQKPRGVMDVSEGGFKTDRITLTKIASYAQGDLKELLDSLIRFNAIDTYLNTFISGIKNFTSKETRILRPKFMQCVTATGRLSSRDPNFQNQPRARTFPIRKVVTSRWNGGSIMEIDFSQLEFRTAVYLAQDKQGMEDIDNNIDVHQYTADTIGISRQDAKAHTFKPLYGGMSGTEEEKKYYSEFLKKYKDIKHWHDVLQSNAIEFKIIKLPTGREYSFPYAERMPWGGSSYSTQIKNYPVQGLATADIVPITCINIWKIMKAKKVKSLLINTVHDSVIADVHPEEENIMKEIMKDGAQKVILSLKEIYDINFNVPLDTELKTGYNWLDLTTIT